MGGAIDFHSVPVWIRDIIRIDWPLCTDSMSSACHVHAGGAAFPTAVIVSKMCITLQIILKWKRNVEQGLQVWGDKGAHIIEGHPCSCFQADGHFVGASGLNTNDEDARINAFHKSCNSSSHACNQETEVLQASHQEVYINSA